MKKGLNNKLRFFSVCIILLAYSQQLIAQQPRPVPAAYIQGVVSVNFVRTWDVMAPEQDPNALMTRPLKDVKQSTQYLDGLGRPLQTVIKQGSLATSSSANDMVSPVEYDGFDREQFKYFPFAANSTGGYSTSDGKFKLNPFQQQETFMTSQYGTQAETFFYNKTNFEASPIDRVTDSYAPGNSWVGSENNTDPATRRNVQMKDYLNTAIDVVRIWTVTDDPTLGQFGSYTTTTTYSAGQLYKNITIDEQKKQVIEFIDKEDRVILKKVQLTASADNGTGSSHSGWLCTYYIYDDLNNLRCVVQPRGVELLELNSWNMNYSSGVILDEQCFRYEYDQWNRMIKKKVPGAASVCMVYDARDRIVLTQDGNLAGQGKWAYTKYDDLNRLIATGLFPSTLTWAQHAANTVGSTTYPTLSGEEELTHMFYDDYTWLSSYSNPLPSSYNNGYDSYFQSASNTTWPYAQANMPATQLKGILTGSRIKVLSTAIYLYTVNFYDQNGRVIQTQSTNFTGATDINTTQYTWVGQPLVTVQMQKKYGIGTEDNITVITKMQYDDLGRVLNIKKTVNSVINTVVVNKAEQITVQNEYDQLGQLKKKTLGVNNLETLNYDYNIRGWLLGENRDYAKDANNNHYFGFDLGYDKLNNSIINNQTYLTPQYNGNIAGTVWKSKGDGEKRKYDFSYDAVNRILSADFNQYSGSVFDRSAQVDFSLSNMSYDANGNILTMNQKGLKITTSPTIDQLTYTYLPGSNKLQQVSDGANENSSVLGDFKYDPATKTATDYSYDANGNMYIDKNKKIDFISYNYLNIPDGFSIKDNSNTINTIMYKYDATGNKLQKEVYPGAVAPGKITLYLGSTVYQDNVLQFLGQEEGRIRFKPAAGSIPASFEYDYMIKDHLDNVRMVLTEEQQQDIYPAATLEPNLLGNENTYYTIDQNNIVSNSTANNLWDLNQIPQNYFNNNGILNNNPSCTGTLCTTDNSQKLYQLNSNTNKTGLGITLKVMAGDKIDVFGKSYYFTNTNGTSGNSSLPIIDLLTAFLNAPAAAATTGIHGGVTATQINTTAGIAGINSMMSNQSSQSNAVPNKPRAFINVIIFDEQFKAVDYKVSMVGDNSQVKDHYSELQNLTIPKNGFVYIYCSNESPVNVFFDNLQVIHTKGAILEETHYYPFGLAMAGISSKAAGKLQNKKLFNGNELQNNEFTDGSGLELYDFNARTYSQQIGRFIQIDPTPEDGDQESLTPYHFSGNNPSTFNDPNGKCPWCWGAIIGAAMEYASQVAGNLANGKSFSESLTQNIDYGAILISAGSGALTGGVSAFAPKSKLLKVAKKGLEIVIGGAESAAQQYNKTSTVSLTKTLNDMGSNIIAGKLTENIKVNKFVGEAQKDLKRAQKISAKDPKSTGRSATVKKLKSKVSRQQQTNRNAQQAASEAISKPLQAGADALNKRPKVKVSLPIPKVDNAAVQMKTPQWW